MSAFSHLSGFQKVQFALFRDQTGLVAAISQTVSLMNAQRTKKPRMIAGISRSFERKEPPPSSPDQQNTNCVIEIC
jgi:hypothetical protein